MQREKTALESFTNMNQGSSSNSASLDHSDSMDNMVDPVESRLIEHDVNFAQRSSGWQQGESSYTANNLLQAFRNRSDMLGWSSSLDGNDPRSDNWSFESSNMSDTSYVGHQANNRSLGMQNNVFNCPSLDINSNHVNMGAGLSHALHKSDDSEARIGPSLHASFTNAGNSSGSYCTFLENNDSSFGTSGSSCKRKALEGTSSNQPTDNIMQHPLPGCYTSPGNLTISPTNNHLEQSNYKSGVGTSRIAPSFFSSSSGPRISEGSSRNFPIRSNLAHNDPVLFESPIGTSGRHDANYASCPNSSADSLQVRSAMNLSMNPNNTSTQPHLMRADESTGNHPYPWHGSFSSRVGSSSRSSERGPRVREEGTIRSYYRNNNLEYPVNLLASGTREDEIDWSFAPGTSASSRNHLSTSRAGPSSSVQASSSAWLPHQNQSSLSDDWIYYPNTDSGSGIRRAHFELFPSASSLLDEADVTSQTQHQSDQRSAALLMDMPGNNSSNLRALAVEGRYRLIRQALSALRRGGRSQAEDFLLIDPYINGFAELHDRHRNLRLDVDNMSYEELLALGEQIGDVNTGLSEDKIKGSMKQRKYETTLEPCCICQEDYIVGDDIGILDCGHEFHPDCIIKWLSLKNLCPICKMTALKT